MGYPEKYLAGRFVQGGDAPGCPTCRSGAGGFMVEVDGRRKLWVRDCEVCGGRQPLSLHLPDHQPVEHDGMGVTR